MLVAIPQFGRYTAPARGGVLEVVILPPEPLSVATSEPAPSSPQRTPGPERMTVENPPGLQPERQAPVLALSAPRPVAEGSFVAPTASALEPPASAPGQKGQVASVAVTPPNFSAAYLRNPAPHYPIVARRTGEQGTVMLRVLVSREGLPGRVDVEKSSGSTHLDAAALEAVKAWRFAPARKGGETIDSWMLVPIVFRLEGAS